MLLSTHIVKLLVVMFLGIHSFILYASPIGLFLLNVFTILYTAELKAIGKVVFGEAVLPLASPHCLFADGNYISISNYIINYDTYLGV